MGFVVLVLGLMFIFYMLKIGVVLAVILFEMLIFLIKGLMFLGVFIWGQIEAIKDSRTP